MPSPHARLLRAWRRTRYAAGGAEGRIGRRSPGLEAVLARLGARQGAFVSAWNPMSRAMPEGWNRRMAARLGEALRRLPHAPGRGEGRGWGEDHVLVAADPRRVAVIGRRFRQLGIVRVRRGQALRAVLLRALREC